MRSREPQPAMEGFTLIELIIAIAILAFGIVEIYADLAAVSSLPTEAFLRFTATNLAVEAVEVVRNIRDDNFLAGVSFTNGLTGCDAGCQADYKAGTAAAQSQDQLQPYSSGDFLKVDGDGFYGYTRLGRLDIPTVFRRKITITQPSADALKVVVLVTWDYSGKPRSFSTETFLYNWH